MIEYSFIMVIVLVNQWNKESSYSLKISISCTKEASARNVKINVILYICSGRNRAETAADNYSYLKSNSYSIFSYYGRSERHNSHRHIWWDCTYYSDQPTNTAVYTMLRRASNVEYPSRSSGRNITEKCELMISTYSKLTKWHQSRHSRYM